MRTREATLLLAAAVLAAPGCAYYSFTGATIPSHLSTLAVPLAEDRSVSTVTGLDEQLTRLLVDRFVSQTRLSLEPTDAEADAVLTATIDRYQNQPASVGGDERATRNRVTRSVAVVYRDQVQDREVLRRTFSGFEEYDALDPDQEAGAAAAALVKIADDVFTAATSEW
jgi:hypothetical protein